jgi:mannan endo-1,4-beta-mannosidase
MRRLLAAVAAAGCIAIAIAGCQLPFVHSTAGHATAAKPVDIHFPAVGVYETNELHSYAGVTAFGQATDTPIKIVTYYTNWGHPFDTAFATQAASHGAVTLVMWQPYAPLQWIAKGHGDKFLRSYAAQVKAFKDPVIIAFGHEMNGCYYPWGNCRTTSKTFVKAWRHVVHVFRQMDVTNVRWLWEVKVGHPKLVQADYPGDKYVNYVGVTGYYTTAKSSFKDNLLPTIDLIRKFTHRPMIIGETGIAPSQHRSAQIINLFRGARYNHIDAVIYFDVDQKSTSRYNQNWSLGASRASLLAFFRGAKSYGAG